MYEKLTNFSFSESLSEYNKPATLNTTVTILIFAMSMLLI
jgi:hypothetical protein